MRVRHGSEPLGSRSGCGCRDVARLPASHFGLRVAPACNTLRAGGCAASTFRYPVRVGLTQPPALKVLHPLACALAPAGFRAGIPQRAKAQAGECPGVVGATRANRCKLSHSKRRQNRPSLRARFWESNPSHHLSPAFHGGGLPVVAGGEPGLPFLCFRATFGRHGPTCASPLRIHHCRIPSGAEFSRDLPSEASKEPCALSDCPLRLLPRS